jgi:cytoskeleton protein RodZ
MFEIGNSLREARLRQHLDFSSAEQATKIRGKYLRALEEEQFEVLPAETYVRGFLRTYAEFLGLDGQLYVDEYNSRFVVGEDDALVPGRPRRSQARPHAQRRLAAGAVAAALVAIAAIAGLVILAWKFGGGDSSPASYPGLGNNATTQDRRHVSTGDVAAQPPRVQLVVTAARGSSWILVRSGSPSGKELYRGTLDLGQTQQFSARRLWLNVEAPQNIDARVNGKRATLAGTKPVVFVVTPGGIRRAATPA